MVQYTTKSKGYNPEVDTDKTKSIFESIFIISITYTN
jgi:hypothetical protein